MKTVYKFTVGNSNEPVLVELDVDGGQMVRASRARQEAKAAAGSLEGALAKLQPIIPVLEAAIGLLSAGGKSPELAFGLKLTPDGDIIVSAGQNESNFVVTLRQS